MCSEHFEDKDFKGEGKSKLKDRKVAPVFWRHSKYCLPRGFAENEDVNMETEEIVAENMVDSNSERTMDINSDSHEHRIQIFDTENTNKVGDHFENGDNILLISGKRKNFENMEMVNIAQPENKTSLDLENFSNINDYKSYTQNLEAEDTDEVHNLAEDNEEILLISEEYIESTNKIDKFKTKVAKIQKKNLCQKCQFLQ